MRIAWQIRDFIRYDLSQGIKNLIRWFPIIWRDRDWDWKFLACIMEFKLRTMSENMRIYGVATTAARDARQMLICAELLKRLQADSMKDFPHSSRGTLSFSTLFIHETRMTEWQKMLGRYLGKYLRNWWD